MQDKVSKTGDEKMSEKSLKEHDKHCEFCKGYKKYLKQVSKK